MIQGTTQITAVDQEGRNYIANVKEGDLWYFPPGIPHSLQATADDPEGSEFLLVSTGLTTRRGPRLTQDTDLPKR